MIENKFILMWFTGRKPTRVFGKNVRFNKHRYADVGWAMLEFGEETIGRDALPKGPQPGDQIAEESYADPYCERGADQRQDTHEAVPAIGQAGEPDTVGG